MPRRMRTPCPVPGCPELTPAGSGRCAAHKRRDARARQEAGARAYGTAKWKRVRAAFLYSHPWCVLCGAPARVADHYPLSRKTLVSRGIDPDTPRHLRPLCTRCHNSETAKHQPGGFAAERRRKTN